MRGLIRERVTIGSRSKNTIQISGKSYLNFSSNDYLGLNTDGRIKQAFKQGVDQYGFGSGASAIISGYCSSQQSLEEKFAEFVGREKALFFNSGFSANQGVISTIANRDTQIMADKDCHASIIDGAILSRAKLHRYPHQDLVRLNKKLTKIHRKTLVISESVFSMSGDITDLNKLSQLTQHHNQTLLIDDGHGFGVLDNALLLSDKIDYLVTPFGKALGGVGAMVSGKSDCIEPLIQQARSYHYTTALPPAIAVANLKALEILQTEAWRREQLTQLNLQLIEKAKQLGLPLVSVDPTPIHAIWVGDNQWACDIQQKLREHGYYVACIRPPTVPVHTARLRISINCHHDARMIHDLLETIARYYPDERRG